MPVVNPPRRTSTKINERRTPWIVTFAWTVLYAIVAYFIAVFVFVVLERVTRLPTNPIWDEGGFRSALLFLLVVIADALILVPYFQNEWGPGARTLALFSAVFVLAYAIFHATGVVDPNIPMNAFVQYVVDPIRLHFAV